MTLPELTNQASWNKKIEIARVLKDWTQDQAAKECGTNQKVYWNWEKGLNYPRPNSRKAICRAFEMQEVEIFGEVNR